MSIAINMLIAVVTIIFRFVVIMFQSIAPDCGLLISKGFAICLAMSNLKSEYLH